MVVWRGTRSVKTRADHTTPSWPKLCAERRKRRVSAEREPVRIRSFVRQSQADVGVACERDSVSAPFYERQCQRGCTKDGGHSTPHPYAS
jgi:hypothetical protein